MTIEGSNERVFIVGLAEFRLALKRAGGSLSKRIQVANKRAAETVASKARDAYTSLYTPISHEGEGSIRATASQTSASVKMGRPSVPYMIGQEFGSYGRYRQFTAPGGHKDLERWEADASISSGRKRTDGSTYFTGAAGRFLYPTFRRERDALIKNYGALLEGAIEEVAA